MNAELMLAIGLFLIAYTVFIIYLIDMLFGYNDHELVAELEEYIDREMTEVGRDIITSLDMPAEVDRYLKHHCLHAVMAQVPASDGPSAYDVHLYVVDAEYVEPNDSKHEVPITHAGLGRILTAIDTGEIV